MKHVTAIIAVLVLIMCSGCSDLAGKEKIGQLW